MGRKEWVERRSFVSQSIMKYKREEEDVYDSEDPRGKRILPKEIKSGSIHQLIKVASLASAGKARWCGGRWLES